MQIAALRKRGMYLLLLSCHAFVGITILNCQATYRPSQWLCVAGLILVSAKQSRVRSQISLLWSEDGVLFHEATCTIWSQLNVSQFWFVCIYCWSFLHVKLSLCFIVICIILFTNTNFDKQIFVFWLTLINERRFVTPTLNVAAEWQSFVLGNHSTVYGLRYWQRR